MLTRIEEIEHTGPALKARRVRWDDGTIRITSSSAVKALSLESDMSLTPSELENRLSEVEPTLARDRALRLLGYRERSISELTRRLTDDGFPEAVASGVVASLRASGLVDDERFAENLIRTRRSAGYGRQRIVRELIQSGIEREAAESLLSAHNEEDGEAERLKGLIAAHPPTDPRSRERLLRRLIAKGFAMGDILDALNDSESAECALPDEDLLP